MITVGILCGGKSRRYGTDKAMERFHGRSFLQYLIDEFSGYEEVLVSCADPAIYAEVDAHFVADEIPGIGPIEGLRQLLVRSTHDWVFACAVDMPYLEADLVKYIAFGIAPQTQVVTLTVEGERQPLCALYHKSVLPRIDAMIAKGDYKLHRLLDQADLAMMPVELSRFDARSVSNLNTKREYELSKEIPLIAFCGYKNTGKTTYVTKLIAALTARGYRIGVIKHDGHGFEMDKEGTDTYLYNEHGAQQILLYSPTKLAFLSNESLNTKEMTKYFHDVDLIVVEGMKGSTLPKFELVANEEEALPASNPVHRLGIITDRAEPDYLRPGERLFTRDDIDAMVQYLVTYMK